MSFRDGKSCETTSQTTHRLGENAFADHRVQAPDGRNLHVTPEQPLGFVAKADEGEAGLPRHVVHKQVKVTVRTCLTPCKRAEYPNVPYSVTFPEPAKL